jgi:outer membrane receptor protein involved in Fe transport
MRYARCVGGLSLTLGALVGAPRAAHAQDVEVPVLVIENPDTGEPNEGDDELDLANLVASAAKSVTTVQEAPAIITIITSDELRDRQPRMLTDIIDLIPGFLRLDAFYGMFPVALVRGTPQGVLTLHDSFSLFDPEFNVGTVHRGIPLEMVKRIETISGPGGVLWGANSYLGVTNLITKDAEDIDGVEANLSYTDGRGDRSAYRGYVMAGLPQFLGKEDWGLVLHVSFEDYKGPIYTRPRHMFSTPLPNPNSVYFYGPITESDPARSTMFSVDGKLALGQLTLQWSVPVNHMFTSSGFNGPIALEHLPEDDLPECTPLPTTDPGVDDPGDRCYDRGRATRKTETDFYERYGLAEYKIRFSQGAGLSVKSYFIQFVRIQDPILVLMPVPGLLEGGLAFTEKPNAYRVGGSIDGDLELGTKVRALYGFEAFHEWVPDNTTADGSRQGAGVQTHFLGPYDLDRIPIPCPRTGTWNPGTQTPSNTEPIAGCPLTFSFEVSRSTLGGFASLQVRPTKRLILDGGVRLQAAPRIASLDRSYGLTPTLAAAAVYEFVPGWHLKFNYAEGFRPPVFQDTDSNGEAVQIDGDPDLGVERSRSGQAEINARLLKNQNRIRELDLRADYSYTELTNFIAFIGGRHANTGDRGIHSAELLAKLYLKGGHRVELGYTFNAIAMADKGAFYSVPNNWFNLSSVNPLPWHLELATVLRVYGAIEDPNRRVEARGLTQDPLTGAAFPSDPMQVVTVGATETVIDRMAPAAEVQVGLRWLPSEKLSLQLTEYNAFANERGSYDNASDLEPRLEITPAAFESYRVFVSGTYMF